MSGELTGTAGLRDPGRGRVRRPFPASRPAGPLGEEPSSRAEGGGGGSPALQPRALGGGASYDSAFRAKFLNRRRKVRPHPGDL